MRMRGLIVIASLLPATMTAQRRPVPGGSRPPYIDPAPPSRQPEPIARAVAYQRMRLSLESYPLVGYVRTSGFTGSATSAWMTLGSGVRADYRVAPLVSTTLDLTSSLAGGPASVTTAELGTRIHAERSERGVDPFVDLRVGYVETSNGLFGFGDGVTGGSASSPLMYSHGWGGIVGVGAEYGLTRTFSLTTELLATQSRMTAQEIQGGTVATPAYTLRTVRYTLGLRYNPVRTIYR
jgi:hypothetical protein